VRDAGLRRDLAQPFAEVRLVLAGQHGKRIGMRQPETLAEQRGGQGAELLVCGDDRSDTASLVLARQPIDETKDVE